MPIVRTYACEACGHFTEVTLPAELWEAEAPECPQCAAGRMGQEFKPPAIGGSARARAVALAESIAEKDYGVADMHIEGYEGVRNKVTYKDQKPTVNASQWTSNREAIEAAAAIGRATRLAHGSGLDILQKALKTGDQPDLIENSKRRMRMQGPW